MAHLNSSTADDTTDGEYTHTFAALESISHLLIGAPPKDIGDLAVFKGTTVNTRFYTNGLNVSAIPVPAAVWLFSSGLLGLVGMERRKTYAGIV